MIDCVGSPEFSNSSTSPFVSKQKTDVSGQPSKGAVSPLCTATALRR